MNVNDELTKMAGDDYCYVTTVGRKTGNPHEIEIWFGVVNDSIYLISGGGEKSDWVKNMRATPNVSVRIRENNFKGAVHFDLDEAQAMNIRKLMAAKYQGWRAGKKFSDWARNGLIVGIKLEFREE